MTKAMLVAAPTSGSGKTSVCRGLVAALANGASGRALTVQTFKMGPDYLDPLHLSIASGLACHNLDPWMMGREACQELFERKTIRAAARPDLAVVEGAMGLYDGGDPTSNAGSSADLARLLGIPAVLVVDIAGQARSAAALIKGFVDFDPELRIAGVILNRAGSKKHAELVTAALKEALPQIPVFGWLPVREGLDLPGRHLGLQPPGPAAAGKSAALGDWVREHVNFTALLSALPDLPGKAARQAARNEILKGGEEGDFARPRIAVSRDDAMFFLYQENLDCLRAAGAEVVFFSPLADTSLPAGCCGVYLCGGYPELYGEELSSNQTMLKSVRVFIERGGPVYAECGGYMYLMSELKDAAGEVWPLVGHFPWPCRMEARRQALGYREVRALAPSCLGPAGIRARGHVFHYSAAAEPELNPDPLPGEVLPETIRLFSAVNAAGRQKAPLGVRQGSVVASYLHLHFASNPDLARNFTAACAAFGAVHEFI